MVPTSFLLMKSSKRSVMPGMERCLHLQTTLFTFHSTPADKPFTLSQTLNTEDLRSTWPDALLLTTWPVGS
jgi:hypothetical protein